MRFGGESQELQAGGRVKKGGVAGKKKDFRKQNGGERSVTRGGQGDDHTP